MADIRVRKYYTQYIESTSIQIQSQHWGSEIQRSMEVVSLDYFNRTRVFVAIEAIKAKITFFSKNPNFFIAPMAMKTIKGYIRGLFCHLFLSVDFLNTIFQ